MMWVEKGSGTAVGAAQQLERFKLASICMGGGPFRSAQLSALPLICPSLLIHYVSLTLVPYLRHMPCLLCACRALRCCP
jgi:hypothetical protein